ncbi:MAG: glycosyltransferase [Pseudomonadales bacterium]|nr:glycosyltransferase [Pseudomonadales bacterium]
MVFLPMVVDINRYLVIGSLSEDNVFHTGWIRSPSTAPYLNEIVGVLEQLGQEGRVQLTVIGGKAPAIENIDVMELPWSESAEVQQINEFDVGIMPLPKSEWSLGNCAFKLIQYMACGVPVVGSRMGANVDVVDQQSGFLANSEEDWLVAFRTLRDDAKLRLEMGSHARRHIEKDYLL